MKPSFFEIRKQATTKAHSMTCPECDSVGQLEYADDEVLVCRSCNYSIEAEDLSSKWQEKLEDELGFYDNDFDDDDDCDEENSESISVYDAAVIWASHGKDEDYTFGYTEEELEDAL